MPIVRHAKLTTSQQCERKPLWQSVCYTQWMSILHSPASLTYLSIFIPHILHSFRTLVVHIFIFRNQHHPQIVLKPWTVHCTVCEDVEEGQRQTKQTTMMVAGLEEKICLQSFIILVFPYMEYVTILSEAEQSLSKAELLIRDTYLQAVCLEQIWLCVSMKHCCTPLQHSLCLHPGLWGGKTTVNTDS